MSDKVTTSDAGSCGEETNSGIAESFDTRKQLADWANSKDEWLRLLVSEVVATGRPVGVSTIEKAYQLFRQEKAFDERELPPTPKIDVFAARDELAPPLSLIRLSEVHGVNALIPGSVIEPNEGLTILYGENGTGKTGYSRIFKALANSRTADTILGNVNKTETFEDQTAKLEFKIGNDVQELKWRGERGVGPFTRMLIFDSPGVTPHIDDALEYVYTPASLALFTHVTVAIQDVAAKIDAAVSALSNSNSNLLNRFDKDSSVYPLIDNLGASTDLEQLRTKAIVGDCADIQLKRLGQELAALQADIFRPQIAALKAEQRLLTQADTVAEVLATFDVNEYNRALTRKTRLATDYEAFRSQLFTSGDLPSEPDETWSQFIRSGEIYRRHLIELGVYDSDHCLYCRQPLLDSARDLLSRYSKYLEDKVSTELQSVENALAKLKYQVDAVQINELTTFLQENMESDDQPSYFAQIETIEATRNALTKMMIEGASISLDVPELLSRPKDDIIAELLAVESRLVKLEEQQRNQTQALARKQVEYLECKDAVELGKSLAFIEAQVENAKEAAQMKALRRQLSQLSKDVTTLSKKASNQLINLNFDALFFEECNALRAPVLKLKFVGREGKAQRRKVISDKYKPSKVLSEGEQKVLALADFLAEARLAGINAPVIFDDPVSSLDHRRIKEVAQRVARLAEDNQVIIFTHDIMFTGMLLDLLEDSKRCACFLITDEEGKGKVTRGTPRWDSLNGIKRRINETIEKAERKDGNDRDELVRVGYGWLRSWCEVFTETELLRRVTQRYQPNVAMTRLSSINMTKLGEIIPKITKIFEESCRYIDAHSQPLVTLGVSPTLKQLKQHWKELQELKRLNDCK